MTKLSVNLNKVALLRNARGRDYPGVIDFAEKSIKSGADGITIHPRPDQRHARFDDIESLKKLCLDYGVELNIEGYPSPDLIELCIQNEVDQMTLVPDSSDQITSDHGWIVSQEERLLSSVLIKLNIAGIRSSLFMDLSPDEINRAKAVGADRIELHTESYARSFEQQTHTEHVESFTLAYETAVNAGLGVNAGHDLDLQNLGFFLRQVPVQEVSIGHALTVEALNFGWQKTIASYRAICHP